MTDKNAFDYDLAFSRNIGLTNPEEQQVLRRSRIGVAGLGGVGGVHVTTLARMGVGAFHLADFDEFEIHNFNRQVGATMSTLGRNKAEVMRAMLLDINPEAQCTLFGEGVTPATIDRFLSRVDIVVDGLDYFAVDARELLYRETYSRGIPVIAAGPIGASAALLVFVPGGVTWHDYFAMDLARDDLDKYILFFIGTAPAATQMSYMDRSRVRLSEKRGPSLSLGVQLCSGVVAAEAMKILLKRGPVFPAPYYQQFDAYKCKYVRGKLRWGNRGPLQRLKLRLLRRMLGSMEA